MKYLLRVNRGQQEQRAIMPEFNRCCEMPVQPSDFVDLIRSNALRHQFWEIAARCQGVEVPDRAASSHVAARASAAQGLRGYLITSSSEDCGLLEVSIEDALRKSECIREIFDDDDFAMATKDVASGLALEREYIHDDGTFVPDGFYVLTCWGIFDIQ